MEPTSKSKGFVTATKKANSQKGSDADQGTNPPEEVADTAPREKKNKIQKEVKGSRQLRAKERDQHTARGRPRRYGNLGSASWKQSLKSPQRKKSKKKTTFVGAGAGDILMLKTLLRGLIDFAGNTF